MAGVAMSKTPLHLRIKRLSKTEALRRLKNGETVLTHDGHTLCLLNEGKDLYFLAYDYSLQEMTWQPIDGKWFNNDTGHWPVKKQVDHLLGKAYRLQGMWS